MTRRYGKTDSKGRHILYTVYRSKDEQIICFEEPARRAAEILGIKPASLYEHVSRQRRNPDKKWSYKVELTYIEDLE